MISDEARWYVVHTYSGYENKVKANIEKTVENRGMQDQIFEVSVPLQDVVEMKDGRKKTVQRKVFPGYVLLNMIMNDETWYVVRNTRGVTSFVGPGSKPVPLTDAEVRAMGIGGLPVVDGSGELVGIITDHDIFRVLVDFCGASKGGLQLAFMLPDKPGVLTPIFEAISQNGGNVLSVLTSRGKTQEGTSHVYIRLHAMDSEKEKALIENMKKAMPLEYWMDDEFHCNRNC